MIQLHLKKLDLAFFFLLSGLHPIVASKCSSKLASNARQNFFKCYPYCWTAPNNKNDLVETDHKTYILQKSDEELGGKTSRFAQGSPHFSCKLNVSESWVGGFPEFQHGVTSTVAGMSNMFNQLVYLESHRLSMSHEFAQIQEEKLFCLCGFWG